MDKSAWSTLSVEQFAAYLDGNLSPEEMNEMEMLIADDPDMEDLVRLSDSIDEQVQRLEFEDTAGTAPESFLETDDFDIPDLNALDDAGLEAAATFEDDAPGNEPPSDHPAESDRFEGEDDDYGMSDPETTLTDDPGESDPWDSPGDNPEDGFHLGEDYPKEF